MVTENIKSYTDEEVINLINKIVMGETSAELSDLKVILAEASGRKLEKGYINIIAEKIKEKVQPEKTVETKRVSEKKDKKEDPLENTKKFTFDDVYSIDDEDEEDDETEERYPVLSFLVGMYKIFAWVLFVGIIVTGGIISLMFFKNAILTVCAIMFACIVSSVVFLLAFLGVSEKIELKLDIESHLRELANK